MALYPPAIKMLLPQNTPGALGPEQPGGKGSENIIPCLIICHTNGSNQSLEAAFNYWKDPVRAAGKEATFQLETAPPSGKGRLGQMMDTTRRADSTGDANAFWRNGKRYGAISIESGDLGSPWAKNWTDLGQRAQLVDLLVWLCQTHGIPPVLARPNPAGGWDGIGYHNQPPYHDEWNIHSHVCPGVGKIAEMPDIIATVASRLAGEPTPPPGDDMSAEDVAAINTHTDQQMAALRTNVRNDIVGLLRAPEFRLNQFGGTDKPIGLTDAELAAAVDKIIAAIPAGGTSGGSVDTAAVLAGVKALLNQQVSSTVVP